MARFTWWLALALTGCTCGDNTLGAGDAGPGDGGLATDGRPRSDGAPPLSFVDIAIGGCEALDAGSAPCEGASPLALSFSALAPSPIQVYLWDFGDGVISTAAAPEHIYTTPGIYSVSLDVEGPGGALGVTSANAIGVLGGALGAACTSDTACASGLCVCDPTDGSCAAGLAGRGICTAPCGVATPCAEGVCADLGPSGPAAPEDWQRALCLPACDAGCADGLTCRSLLDDDGAWISACLPASVLADLGESCVDAAGAADNDRCTSGQCIAEGARGLCGFDCAAEACPADTACATFTGALGDQCLRDCAVSACDADPWLACEQPGNGGALGFTVPGAPSASGYCAPEFCADAPLTDCPDGQCTAAYCGP